MHGVLGSARATGASPHVQIARSAEQAHGLPTADAPAGAALAVIYTFDRSWTRVRVEVAMWLT